jgi:hypothetical protein
MQQKLQTSPLLLFDPRGEVREAVSPIAERKRTLEGLRLGVLDNSKWNANKILRGASSALSRRAGFAAVNYYVKESFSKDAAAELIERIASDNDVVLTAIGDCGSCCSCCIRDAIALEKAGLPSAAIITTEFVAESALTRMALGMAGLPVVVIDHPVSSITAAEIASRVAAAATQAEEVWLGRTPRPLPEAVDPERAAP